MKASPILQISYEGWIIMISDIRGRQIAAPDVNHQIKVQPNPANGGRQFGDIPA